MPSRTLGVDGVFLESQQQTDYEKNINEFLSQNKDLIITVGFLLADATKAAADANPDAKFAIIDSPSNAANIKGLLFDVGPASLPGRLPGGRHERDRHGLHLRRHQHPARDRVHDRLPERRRVLQRSRRALTCSCSVGTTPANDGAFTGNFESTDDGRRFAENFFDEGCDVIIPVAGPVGLGSAAAAKDRGLMMIGVDTDQYVSAPEFGDVWLTSVLKNMDKAVFDTIAGAGGRHPDPGRRLPGHAGQRRRGPWPLPRLRRQGVGRADRPN